MTTRFGYLFACAALAAGCSYDVHTDADVDVDGEFFVQFDEIGECGGPERRIENDTGVTTYTETPVEGGCRIDFRWSGTVVDMADVAGEVESKLEDGMTLADVEILVIDMTVGQIELRDSGENLVTPPVVPAFDAQVEVDGEVVMTFSVQDAARIVAGPVTFELPPEVVKLANRVLQDVRPLRAKASGSFVAPADWYEAFAGEQFDLWFATKNHFEVELTKEII